MRGKGKDERFRNIIRGYYRNHKRSFPWRKTRDPYRILVSEIMLQQTGVSRVIPKYREFIRRFPTIEALARASFANVLSLWQGLGYNRRAKYLRDTAKCIVHDYRGRFPRTKGELLKLPGVGDYTARAIRVFAFNTPEPLLETNIRTVFIDFFFRDKKTVHDKEIMPLIERTCDWRNPREWFSALMDYGAMIKDTQGNSGRKSIHYIKQQPFRGSDRELRGRILRELVRTKHLTPVSVMKTAGITDTKRMKKILLGLEKESLVRRRGRVFTLA